jgi:hypothetical protein
LKSEGMMINSPDPKLFQDALLEKYVGPLA